MTVEGNQPSVLLITDSDYDEKSATIDVGFLVVCIIFIFLGSCGVLSNGRVFCLFFETKTVRNI